MALAGGGADKFGNRYEAFWTVRCLLLLIGGKYSKIKLEPPGSEGEGVEFVLESDEGKEYHQVKQRSRGQWTLHALGGAGILAAFYSKLSDPSATCWFVSSNPTDSLKNLVERAHMATSEQELELKFAKDKTINQELLHLCSIWNCSCATAWKYLQRIKVRTVDADHLQREVETHMGFLVEGNSSAARAVLADFAQEQTHREVIALDVWRRLEQAGLKRQDWRNDPSILERVKSLNRRFLGLLQPAAVGGQWIERAETDEVVNRLLNPDGKRAVLVSGEAGVGKSGVLYLALETIQQKGWPLLFFRADHLSEARNPSEVGAQLGLPKSPAQVLAGIAQGRDAVLVIDQLDAVSKTSGRHPEFYDQSIHEIILQALTYPNLRLLLACRKFDLEQDDRFLELVKDNGIAVEVQAKRLGKEKVLEALERLGIPTDGLNERQLELLSVPLHLKLLVEGLKTGESPSAFATVTELYERYWEAKQDQVKTRLAREPRWTEVMDRLCDHMSERQELSAPKVRLDDLRDDLRAIASEGVLVMSEKRVAFFHEGFFDYAYARRFAARGGSLMELLTGSEQHLFRRAQVRQILVQLRDSDPESYLRDLKGLLHSGKVRFHIQQVVIALLSTFPDPTEAEWRIVEWWLESDQPYLISEVWSLPRKSKVWFELLDGLSVFERGLRDPEGNKLRAMYFVLRVAFEHSPDRVMELIEPYYGTSEDWDHRFAHMVRHPYFLPKSRRLFELFLQHWETGKLDQGHDFWMDIDDLPKTHPEWACEAIKLFFKRHIVLAKRAGEPHPFERYRDGYKIPQSHHDDEVMEACAEAAPEKFLLAVLPMLIYVSEDNLSNDAAWPREDKVWRVTDYTPRMGDLRASIVRHVEVALRKLATANPPKFSEIVSYLRSLDLEIAQYLACRAYLGDPVRFADDAVDFLCERTERLNLGDRLDRGLICHELLKAVTPHCSEGSIARLEAVLLAFYPAWERRKSYRGHFGRGQLILLEGVDEPRRTPAMQRRLLELRRKFPNLEIRRRSLIRGGFFTSPIAQGSAAKMADENWLSAMKKYSEEGAKSYEETFVIGKANELANVLTEETKKDPRRFVRLMRSMPDTLHSTYFEAILRGLEKAEVETALVVEACLRCYHLPNRISARTICWALRDRGADGLPEEALEMIAWYALNDPNPDKESWDVPAREGQNLDRDVFHAGLNSDRGAAAFHISELVFDSTKYFDYFRPTLELMVQDPSAAVRSCVAQGLTASLNHDREWAVRQFLQLCESRDELLGTHTIERFLWYAVSTHFDQLQPLLDRMMNSEHLQTAQVGARQICLSAIGLESSKAISMAQQALSGNPIQRLGAAEIFSANIHKAAHRDHCEAALQQLFQDEDAKVREEASHCFRELWEVGFGEYESLVHAFIESPSFMSNYSSLIYGLEHTNTRLPPVVCEVAERFLDLAGEGVSDIRTSIAADVHWLSEVVIRLYSQTEDVDILKRCLDLVDRMAQADTHGLERLLESFNR